MTKYHFFLILISVLLPLLSFTQRFESLNQEFPIALCEEIFQDSYGYLWLGTVDGLVRYDGYQVKYYQNDPADNSSLKSNNINAICEDHQGNIWVGLNQNGANILNRKTDQFAPLCIPNLSGECIEKISVNGFSLNSNEEMWVATNQGLYLFDIKNKPELISHYISNKDDPFALSSNSLSDLLLDSKRRLWIKSQNGINRYNDADNNFINFKSNPSYPKGSVLDIAEDRFGKIWLSPRFTEYCLYQWNAEKDEFNPLEDYNDRAMGEFRITFDLSDNLWISSRRVGAFQVLKSTGERIFFDPMESDFHGYPNYYGLDNMTDRFGNVWISGESTVKWPASNKGFQGIKSGSHGVLSVFADNEYIWYCEKEPVRWNKETKEVEKFWPSGLPTNEHNKVESSPARLYQMEFLTENQLLMVTTRNVIIWDKQRDRYTEYPSRYGGPFRDFLLDRESQLLWICPNQVGPITFDLKTKKYNRPKHLRLIDSPETIEKGKNGDLWFGTRYSGLFKYNKNNQQIRQYSPDSNDSLYRISSNTINDILFDSKENIWVATPFGLNSINLKDGQIQQIRKQEGFPNDHVTSILKDDDGNLWLGTQDGLSFFDPSQNQFNHYDQSDGLINSNFYPRSCNQDTEGRLYFGGNLGIDFFNPKEVGFNDIAPDIYIQNISINGSPYVPGIEMERLQSLSLKADQKFLEIELLGLHLTAPEANQYAYRIPEIAADWIQMGTNRRITLANMVPGNYTIQAKASNADGIWSEEQNLLDIHINPPFWQSWWFLLLCAFLLMSFIYFIYKYRIAQIRKQESIKTDFNKKIATLEMKALRAQMNPHFLFNSINSVKSLITKNENQKATQYLTRFSELIRQVLANSEKPLIRLDEQLEALRLYLEIEQLRFQNFSYSIVVDDTINVDFVEVPSLILQPYVENAIWHGLLHKEEGERNVKISVSQQNKFLHLTVEDNGIGRKKAKQLSSTLGKSKSGLGMRATSDRLMYLNEIYGKNASVEIEDLEKNVAGNSIGSGTRVIIKIPLSD